MQDELLRRTQGWLARSYADEASKSLVDELARRVLHAEASQIVLGAKLNRRDEFIAQLQAQIRALGVEPAAYTPTLTAELLNARVAQLEEDVRLLRQWSVTNKT